jgi:hypothetical protein
LQQKPTFGHRDSQAYASASSPLPIDIEKDIGVGASTLLGGGLLGIFWVTLPLLFGREPWTNILFHSDATFVGPGLLILLPVIYLLGRNPGELEISAQGIRVATAKSGRWFYAWGDIESADATSGSVKLLLKGRSDEQNRYNIIPRRFGLKPSELSSIITDGIARFGDANWSSQKTVAPGDDLPAALMRSVKQMLRIYGFILGVFFAVIVVWQALDCMKRLDLQKNGRAIVANVIRIYTSGCGKRGCSLDVEYAFTPEPTAGNARMEYRGYEYIGSSRSPDAPNLIYAKTYRAVPIVYDVNRPTTSSLNFRNRIFEQDPVSAMFKLLGIFAGVLGVVAIIFLATLVPTILKARRAAAESA